MVSHVFLSIYRFASSYSWCVPPTYSIPIWPQPAALPITAAPGSTTDCPPSNSTATPNGQPYDCPGLWLQCLYLCNDTSIQNNTCYNLIERIWGWSVENFSWFSKIEKLSFFFCEGTSVCLSSHIVKEALYTILILNVGNIFIVDFNCNFMIGAVFLWQWCFFNEECHKKG